MADFAYTPDYVYNEEITFLTQVIQMEDGGEVRNSYGSPRRMFALEYEDATESTKDSILAFFQARYGRYDTFTWTNPNDDVSYTVRFVDESLEINETQEEFYVIKMKFIEIIS